MVESGVIGVQYVKKGLEVGALGRGPEVEGIVIHHHGCDAIDLKGVLVRHEAPGHGMGKYVLYCVLDRHYIPSTNFDSASNYTSTVVKVASVCKRQNLAKAIDAFMTGKLDEEIKDASNTDVYIDMLNRGYHSYKIWNSSVGQGQWSSERLSRAEGLDCEMSPTDEMFSSVDEFWQEYNDRMDRTSHDRQIKNLIVD